MKKVSIIIFSILAILLITLGIMYSIDINRMADNKPVLFSTWGYSYAPPLEESEMENSINVSNEAECNVRMVMVNDKLYYDTGIESTVGRCGVMDGQITSTVAETEIPTKNNQSNFGIDYGYQFGIDDVEILIDGKWMIFKSKE